MKIRTTEELISALDADLAWRKKELSVFSQTVSEAKGPALDACLRAAVALLYAHWEGFIKHAAECYIHFVGRRKLATRELHPAFIGMALRKAISRPKDSAQSTYINRIVREIFYSPSSSCPIPWRDEVSTRSNLSSEILKDIVDSLGFDFGTYESKSVLIDEGLLGNRNQIAHGKHILVTHHRFIELRSTVIDMMEAFKTQIENGAVSGQYRR